MRINQLAWAAFAASLFHPFISFVAYNQSDLTPEQTLFTLGMFAVFASVEIGILRLISKLTGRLFLHVIVVATLLHFAFFNYDSWTSLWTHRNEVWEPFLSFIIVSGGSVWTLMRYGKPAVIAQLALIFAVGASALPTYRYMQFQTMVMLQPPPSEHVKPATIEPAKNSPNIYHIMADGYAHHKVLMNLGLDNTPFLKQLTQRGFYVLPKAHANYPLTRYSVAAMQSMEYLFTPGEQMPLHIGFYYHHIKTKNAALNAYKARGYQYIYADNTRYNPRLSCPETADICLQQETDAQHAWRSVFTPLLKKTPLYNFMRLLHGGINAREISTMLSHIKVKAHKPFYMFAMTLPPHYPYLYNADCGLREPERQSYDRFDAEGDVHGYLQNVSCTNIMLYELVDDIIARDPEAIILVHSDHGTSFQFKTALPCPHCMSAPQMAERFPILAAMRLPEHCKTHIPDTLSPVNFHRLILACIDGKTPELLPDISYINWYPFAYGGGDMFVYEKNDVGQTPQDVSPAHQPH